MYESVVCLIFTLNLVLVIPITLYVQVEIFAPFDDDGGVCEDFNTIQRKIMANSNIEHDLIFLTCRRVI